MYTLCVVDDNELDRHVLQLNLASCPVFDYVLYYEGGIPLIDYLKQHVTEENKLPDVIFLDLRMPEYDGWRVLEALQQIYHTLAKKIKVYIVSGSLVEEDVHKASGYDFVNEFIPKPVTKDNLITISQHIRNKSA